MTNKNITSNGAQDDANFSTQQVLALIESTEEFPVDFDDAWQWIGWLKKQAGKDVLLNNFEEGSDFLRKGVKSPSGGRPSEWFVLTIECFKSLAMMAGTTRGKQVRQYFIQCEKELKSKPANRFHDKLHLAPFWYQRQVQFLADNKVPAGYFSIFGETISLVAELESAGYTLPDSSIPDISIGKCWANYLRKEAKINPDDISVMYPHKYPNYAYAVDAKAYLEDYLPKFRKWFRESYKPVKLPAYFKGKDTAALPAISRLLGLPAGVSI